MRKIALSLAVVMLLIPVASYAQTAVTPVCTLDADGVTKTCIGSIEYDGTASYSVTADAVNPTTGDSAKVSAVVVPLCSQLEITRPSGKLQLKWRCSKDLDVSFTLTKQ